MRPSVCRCVQQTRPLVQWWLLAKGMGAWLAVISGFSQQLYWWKVWCLTISITHTAEHSH